MIRRILVAGAVALALALGARLALGGLTARAWEARKHALLEQALFRAAERRPWEVRLESLLERVRASARFGEITASPYRPHVASGAGEPRVLDEFERVWLASLWSELTGLDPVLAELRRLPLQELEWHGAPPALGVLRELTNALCARAWLALGADDDLAAAEAYADCLRLARATDDGTTLGALLRHASEGVTLRSARAALALGLSPTALRAALAPLLEDWAYSPVRAERVIRRDLALLALEPRDAPASDPAGALAYFAPVEAALARAHQPLDQAPWTGTAPAGAEPREPPAQAEALRQWNLATQHLHALHAQRNVALSALAVAAFRERHGAWPTTLSGIDDLPGEHTLDPLGGAALAYSADESGACIGPAAWGERVEGLRDDQGSLYAWRLR